jgi:hypothetical protein
MLAFAELVNTQSIDTSLVAPSVKTSLSSTPWHSLGCSLKVLGCLSTWRRNFVSFIGNFSPFRLLTLNADDDGVDSGEYANAAKYMASEAAFTAVERAMLTHGGV